MENENRDRWPIRPDLNDDDYDVVVAVSGWDVRRNEEIMMLRRAASSSSSSSNSMELKSTIQQQVNSIIGLLFGFDLFAFPFFAALHGADHWRMISILAAFSAALEHAAAHLTLFIQSPLTNQRRFKDQGMALVSVSASHHPLVPINENNESRNCSREWNRQVRAATSRSATCYTIDIKTPATIMPQYR